MWFACSTKYVFPTEVTTEQIMQVIQTGSIQILIRLSWLWVLNLIISLSENLSKGREQQKNSYGQKFHYLLLENKEIDLYLIYGTPDTLFLFKWKLKSREEGQKLRLWSGRGRWKRKDVWDEPKSAALVFAWTLNEKKCCRQCENCWNSKPKFPWLYVWKCN